MPNLATAAVAAWLTDAGSEDLMCSVRAPVADDSPDLAEALEAFGQALDASIEHGATALDHALDRELSAAMANVIARLGPARRLLMLHWLAGAGFDEPHRVIERIADPATPSGAVVLRWMAALLQRERLDRLFSFDRIQTLHAACQAAKLKETHP